PRQDDFGAREVLVQGFGGIGQAVTVGGDDTYLVAGNDDEQAVEVVTDVLLGHGVLHQGQEALELLLAELDLGGLGFGLGDAREIFRRQGLQIEAALTGLELQTLVVEGQADFGGFRQGAQDVLQLAGADGDGDVFAADTGGGGANLDFDIGRQQGQVFTGLLDQYVGEDRQGVTFLDNAADGLQRAENLIARAFK